MALDGPDVSRLAVCQSVKVMLSCKCFFLLHTIASEKIASRPAVEHWQRANVWFLATCRQNILSFILGCPYLSLAPYKASDTVQTSYD